MAIAYNPMRSPYFRVKFSCASPPLLAVWVGHDRNTTDGGRTCGRLPVPAPASQQHAAESRIRRVCCSRLSFASRVNLSSVFEVDVSQQYGNMSDYRDYDTARERPTDVVTGISGLQERRNERLRVVVCYRSACEPAYGTDVISVDRSGMK